QGAQRARAGRPLMATIATVCARGGSKGVPGKNIRPLLGKPLIVYTIEQARRCLGIGGVYVSTDDPAIAEVARRAGAEVPFLRPDHLAEDTTPHLPVVQHALAWMAEREAFTASYVVVLQPTTPLRTGDDIAASVELAKARNAA